MNTPENPQKILLAWSGGKDSTLSLNEIKGNPSYEIVSLLTTINRDYDRVSMHGFRRTLLEKQAASLELPLHEIFIPAQCSNEQYEQAMKNALAGFIQQGVTAVAFGDLFLEDVRKYREENLARVGMQAIFPLWERNTADLIKTFIASGFRGITTSIDTKQLDERFIGRMIDRQFLSELPPCADPCGENGEYHSFVFDGPLFSEPVRFAIGEKVLRDSFYYCDLLD